MEHVLTTVDTTQAAQDSQKQYFLPGRYCVKLENILLHKKRLGGHVFIVETRVLESDNAEIKPGEQRNWVQPLEADAAISRIKCFMGVTQGLDPRRQIDEINKKITGNLCEDVVSGKIPTKNIELSLECFNKRSTKTGKDFTIHAWAPTEDKYVTEN